MKRVMLIAMAMVIFIIAFTVLFPTSSSALNGDAKKVLLCTGAEGTFKLEYPKPGWEYSGPMDLPIVSIDRHHYETSKCTPDYHVIGCPGSCSAILDPTTKVTVVNRKIDRNELSLLNGRKVITIGKVKEKTNKYGDAYLYWVELTILVPDR